MSASLRAAIAGVFLLAAPVSAHPQAGPIAGTWRGSSTCVDREHFPACRDEQVIYEARLTHSSPDTVTISADKIVDGTRVFMGDLFFTQQSDSCWLSEVRTPRAHFLVRLRRAGDRMTGAMTDVPSSRRIRDIVLERVDR